MYLYASGEVGWDHDTLYTLMAFVLLSSHFTAVSFGLESQWCFAEQ